MGTDTPTIEIIARGVWLHEGRVLLCRDVEGGYYALPGGHVDPLEPCARAMEREFLEETGVRVRAGRVGLICEVFFEQRGVPRHEINMVFHVEHPGVAGEEPPEVTSREEHIRFEWVEQVRLVEMDVRPAVIRAWLVSGGDLGDTTPTGWLSVTET